MKMSSIAAFLLFGACLLPQVYALDIDPAKLEAILEQPDILETPAEGFISSSLAPYFKWANAKKDEAAYPVVPVSLGGPKMLFFGAKLQEASFNFANGKLNSIYLCLYNRGDAGDMAIGSFKSFVADIDAKLSVPLGKGVDLKKGILLGSETNHLAKVWIKNNLAFCLKWSYSGNSQKDFRPEYAQLTIEPFDPKNDPRKQSSVGSLKAGMALAKDLPQNLKRDANGNVHIENIPMIDQGAKGYCVDAAVARSLRYYGVDVTQHDLAQITKTQAESGTALKDMLTAIKRVGVRYGVKISELYKDDVLNDAHDFERYVKKYNQVAAKNSRRPVRIVVDGDYYYPDRTFDQMEPDVIKKLRLEDKPGFKNFLRLAKMNIDKGMPLLWSVRLGIVQEPGLPQVSGYHMRLITGYNDKQASFIYSDSWGPDHDLKSMTYEDAWAISEFLMVLVPFK